MNKRGEIYQCPGCFKWDVPPRKKKDDKIEELVKKCGHCDYEYQLTEAISQAIIIQETPFDRNNAYYIDGDSFEGRYNNLTYRYIELGYDGINYKDPELYIGKKLFIRQAGVGLSVAYDEKGAYCPQSVYIYRLKSNDPNFVENLDPLFLLAVLQSRVFAYYVFKRFGEIDASQAFSKLTHVRLSTLPLPIKNWKTEEWMDNHNKVVELVQHMLNGEEIGGTADWEIERIITEMYGLDSEDRSYIVSQLGLVAYHRAMQQLFPSHPPPKPSLREKTKLSASLGS